MAANKLYAKTSAYYNTGFYGKFLDVMTHRKFAKSDSDASMTINKTYANRPDLLAFDLYDQPGLWWVFYQRNPNTLMAPPWDFEAGKTIYVPKITTLRSALGF